MRPTRLIRWLLPVLVIALPAVRAGESGSSPATSSDRRAGALEVFQRLLEAGEAELRRPGSDPSGVAAKAAELAGDPERIAAFVRRQIAFEPYRGLLRGARGALVCRAGNSLDKSLLLREMLEASGRRARIAKGTLSGPQARALVDEYLERDPLAGPLGDYRLGVEDAERIALARDFASSSGLRFELVQDLLARSESESMRLEEEIREVALRELQHLRSGLHLGDLAKGRPAAAWIQDLQSRASEHFWVQILAEGEDESWEDVDAVLAQRRPGDVGPEVSILEGEDLERERHFVVFKVRYRTEGGGDEAILEVPLAADEALFELPSLAVSPAEGLPPLSELTSMDSAALAKVFRGLKKFQATLASGGKTYSSKAFDFEGTTYEVAGDGRIQAVKELGGRIGGLMGGLGGRGEDEKKKPAFLSLEAEISFEGPGAPPRAHSRILFSRKDLSAEPPRIPLLTWEILIQPHPITAPLAIRGALEATIAAWEPAVELLADESLKPSAIDGLASRAPAPYPSFLVNLALLREKSLADALAADPRLRLLWDRPNVSVCERRLSFRTGECCASSQLLVDFVENTVLFVPAEPGAEQAAAEACAAQGVFDTVAEAMALEEAVPGSIVRSAIPLLERSRLTGARWLAAGPGGDLAALALGPEDAAWIREREGGRVILAPARQAADAGESGAWWSLDPETGALVGRISGGAGGALVEYWQASTTFRWFLGVGWCVVDMAYDQSHGNQDTAGARLVLKFARCATFASVNLVYLGAPGAAYRLGAGIVVNVLINWTLGGKGIAGDVAGGLMF